MCLPNVSDIQNKIGATEDYDTSTETSTESIKEPEDPVMPEGNFESAEATEEVTDEQSGKTPLPEETEPTCTIE